MAGRDTDRAAKTIDPPRESSPLESSGPSGSSPLGSCTTLVAPTQGIPPPLPPDNLPTAHSGLHSLGGFKSAISSTQVMGGYIFANKCTARNNLEPSKNSANLLWGFMWKGYKYRTAKERASQKLRESSRSSGKKIMQEK